MRDDPWTVLLLGFAAGLIVAILLEWISKEK